MEKLWWLNGLINIGITTNLMEDEVCKIQLLNKVMVLIAGLSIIFGVLFVVQGCQHLLVYNLFSLLLIAGSLFFHSQNKYPQGLHLFAIGNIALLTSFGVLYGAILAVSIFLILVATVVFFILENARQRHIYNIGFVIGLVGMYIWNYHYGPVFPDIENADYVVAVYCVFIVIQTCLLNVFNSTLNGRQRKINDHQKELNKAIAVTQSALDATTDGVLVVDVNGKVACSNQKFRQMWHIPKEIMNIGNDDVFLGHVLDQLKEPGKFIAKIKELYNQVEATSYDKLYFKDGRIFERYSQPHKVDDSIVGRVWSFRDISTEEKAKIALKERESLFRNLYEYSPVGVIMGRHKNGQLSYANRKFCEMLGYTPWELQSMEVEDITHPDDKDLQKELYVKLSNGEISSFELEKRYLHKNGSIIWAHVSISVARDSDGKVKYDIVIVQNISERKQAEDALENNQSKVKGLLEELRFKNAELEEKVKERTQTLEKSNNELKRSNQDLEQFAYIASHDLQEPLRMVGNFVQLIERRYGELIGSEGKIYIDFAVGGVNRMTKLIQNLLTFSRVGRKDVSFSKVDLNNIIDKKVLDLSQRLKDSKAIVELHQLPAQIFCEPDQLGIVFYNLIGNAIKFNNSSSPQVVIKQEEKAREWLFSVADNGIGIETQYSAKVFEIFKRLHRREEYEGTGIGLSLCKRIVNRHKGDIWFDSTPGNGTTFYFTISKSL